MTLSFIDFFFYLSLLSPVRASLFITTVRFPHYGLHQFGLFNPRFNRSSHLKMIDASQENHYQLITKLIFKIIV
jgi:hypothetical protein